MKTISVEELEWLLERGEVDLVDVRPEEDFRRLHVYGARSLPLSQIDPNSFAVGRRGDESVWLCLMCDRRLRASLAAGLIASAASRNLCVLNGGLQAWVKEGLPVVRPHRSLTLSLLFAYVAEWIWSGVSLFRRPVRLHPV